MRSLLQSPRLKPPAIAAMSTTTAFTWARRGLTGAFIGYGLVREQRRRRKAEHIPDKFVLELDFTRLAIGERPPTPREKLQEALGDEERRERLLLRDAENVTDFLTK